MQRRQNLTPLLLLFGLISFGIAGLSIADMFVPRAFDGILLDASPDKGLRVRDVVPDSGADRAGIRPGHLIVGIGREALRDPDHAAEILSRHRIGDSIVYLVRTSSGLQEVDLELGRRHIGDGPYFFVCALGFAFFFVGLFVLVRQPGLLASQVFFFLGCLFLLFLVCRLRPASYSGVDRWILGIGTFALVLLPPAFLHFYILFPRPAWLEEAREKGQWAAVTWLFGRGWPFLYATPLLVFAVSWLLAAPAVNRAWFGGTPVWNWWILAAFTVLGLL
ncbi:MAG: PDZ domain-containing protein, partial [Acidobacteriota bacterium]